MRMKLCWEGLKDRSAWENAGVKLPGFDYRQMQARTEANPTWIHIGPGNIFRAFIAQIQQELLNKGLTDTGIVAVSTHNHEIVDKVYKPFDNMSLLVSLLPDGSAEHEVIASICHILRMGADYPEEQELLKKMFRNPSLQILSYTITEKGYALRDLQGSFFPVVLRDLERGPESCAHAMSVTAALLLERFRAGGCPMAVVSMDNCAHNGERLRTSVVTIAENWLQRGFVEPEFVTWLKNEEKVSFPWSMIDKITPRPSQELANQLQARGFENMGLIPIDSRTNSAPFVNAEKPQYLVVEDRFPNGRPPMEAAGVYMTDRETVNNTERMKVTTCLNPLHTTLAVYGCLLGYNSIAAEMRDAELKALVEKIGYAEGLPVVVDPKVLSPRDFIHEVLTQRLPNPFIPDTPQRIATDTSQKMAIRFGETIKSYLAREDMDVTTLTYIPLAIAGWIRYLLAVDDGGREMVCSSDPMLETLQTQLSGVTLGSPDSVVGKLEPILSNATLFGTDLVAAGLAGKIKTMVARMLTGPGAVRQTLKEYLQAGFA